MCGIVGYIGNRDAYEVLIKGLKRLEYRGYDSAGIAMYNGSKFNVYKCHGKVSDLEDHVKDKDTKGNIGIGHTRWATHGEPNDINAHPHVSMNGKFILIHNGIIENYAKLKATLEEKGYTFKGETDSEVLVNFIEYIYTESHAQDENFTPDDAVRAALQLVEGAYGIVVMSAEDPETLTVARKGSPIVIGLGNGEYFVASDATPIIEYTNSVIYLNDLDVATISRTGFNLANLKDRRAKIDIQQVDLRLDEIEKNGFDHYMLKEIYEQPRAIADTYRGRLSLDSKNLTLGGLHTVMNELKEAKRIIIVACGTSWHAGLVGEYLFEEFARIPTEVEYASEFRYRNPIINKGDIVIAISQSGETADTLAAIQLAKERGAIVLGICNVVGSSIPRETVAGVYTHAGPEIGVASTKAFTTQITVLTMMAMQVGLANKGLTEKEFTDLVDELYAIPQKVELILQKSESIKQIAEKIKDATNSIYLGRGYLYPVALEGALKLKEISYIHAEGYPSAEMKHGPIALIDERMPVIVLATKDKSYDKIVSNIQEVKARKGVVIAIVTEGDTTIKEMADYVIEVPYSDFALAPLLTVVPLQLIAYYIAVMRGCNVDQPRNLAKSVTVE
ncbi:MAG: glutamine--fructose-6-phosphate transaminase (isomerizing) [Bacteroidales bacterium]|nr:glutamine--fructose-6-phosphate transaminase (isomerizing) [Bacteroidales bacterium]MBO7572742.1 glutamine--fructose-6-phosphate transaminase (isomerizing) [Bacteroidales bacterium]